MFAKSESYFCQGRGLVTLTGPGGVGKTRLAIAVAEALAAGFQDRVAFVSLASISDHDLVVPTIARTLGIEESGQQPVVNLVADYFQQFSVALVLDNVEHVLESAPEIAVLLQACPELILLATGREPLRLRGERVYEVRPLGLPGERAGRHIVADAESPAMRLFVDRAMLATRSFCLADENREAVSEICRRLGGMPLALELAAARMTTFSPDDLLDRLDQPLSLLSRGPRDAPDRQRTMRATIQWSYDLLTQDEQRLFRQLPVFVNGASLEAIESVTTSGSALQEIVALVEKGLVRRHDRPDSPARYDMLEPIRQFALEQSSDSSETTNLSTLHANYFARSVYGLMDRINRPDASDEMASVDREYDNIRVALNWFRQAGPADTGMRMVWDLYVYWFQRGFIAEGIDHIRSMLESSDCGQPTCAHGLALNALTWLRHFRGENTEAMVAGLDCLQVSQTIGDRSLTAHARFALGVCHRAAGDSDRALENFEQALKAFQELGIEPMIARTYCQMGNLHYVAGDFDQARTITQEGLKIAREGQHGLALALALNVMGHIELAADNCEKASAFLRESLSIYRALGSTWAISMIIRSFAGLAHMTDNIGDAVALQIVAGSIPDRLGSERAGDVHDLWANVDLGALRSRMRSRDYDAAVARGREMSVDEAIDLAMTVAIDKTPARPAPLGSLTPREIEVLKLAAAGRSNREVAADLNVSVRTIERHLANIYNKLDVHNRIEAARLAFLHGLVEAATM